jgi:uncharacterized membrane protein
VSDKRPTWRGDFYTGLAIVLPVAISLVIFKWLVLTISDIASILLFFLRWLIDPAFVFDRTGDMFWYWKFLALAIALVLIWVTGHLARDYLGRRLIAFVDAVLLRVPLLNKIHGVVKQVNQAFTSGTSNAFRQVVLVEFPRPGMYALGFVTGADQREVQHRTKEKTVSVFVPTTPNPTSGFLVMVDENKVTKLDMCVTDGIKFIVSLGSVSPPWDPANPTLPTQPILAVPSALPGIAPSDLPLNPMHSSPAPTTPTPEEDTPASRAA